MLESDATTLRMRTLSRALFGGAQYRVEVGAAIAESDGIVCIKDIARLLEDPPGTASVNTEFKALEGAGLLRRLAKTSGERRVFLSREESSFWELCLELRQHARTSTLVRSTR